jgi:hypothetical protein
MTSYQEKLQFVDEEIGRLLDQTRTPLEALNAKIVAAVGGTRFCAVANEPLSPAEVAAANVEPLVKLTTRAWVFARYQDAIRMNREGGTPDERAFTHLEQHVVSALASAASGQSSQSTAWADNVRRMAELTALGDVARLFQDMRKV